VQIMGKKFALNILVSENSFSVTIFASHLRRSQRYENRNLYNCYPSLLII
jgi:hypothetical protein